MRHRYAVQGSLLEALMACSVFAVGIILLLGVFPTAARAVRQGQEVMAASFLAEARLEAVRGLGYDQIGDATQTVGLTSRMNGLTQTHDFTVQTLVTEPQVGRLKRVRVLVSWQRQVSRSLELITYVAKLD